MASQDYQSSVSAEISAEEAFGKIANVSGWWAKGTVGKAKNVGDTFKVDWGETWVDFKIVEAVPNGRIVWQVTDCHLPWLNDKTEWKDTKVVWDLATANGVTQVTMTHAGLTPAVECFKGCEAGWNFYFGKSLLKLFTDDTGLPDQMGTAEA
jgi:Activator of Hsp90 ATPase homolog 1-like protein